MAPAAAKKTRRGSEKRKRSVLLNIRLLPEEDARVRELAAERDQPVAAVLRAALMRELETA